MIKPMRVAAFASSLAGLLMALAAVGSPGPSQWEQPAAALAENISDILGPAQARLVIRNNSTIYIDEIPAIRRLLETDLKAHGIQASGAESANTIRVTLSENVRERLWVAEIIEGNETRVAMVHVDPAVASVTVDQEHIVLHKTVEIGAAELTLGYPLPTRGPVLAAIDVNSGLVVLRQDEISFFAITAAGWLDQKDIPLGSRQVSPRDPHGLLIAAPDKNGFTAYLPGTECAGSHAEPADAGATLGEWTVHCHPSDDPWPILSGPILGAQTGDAMPPVKAFFNAARDYFTGVVTPSVGPGVGPGVGLDLGPFYSAAMLPRPNGAALLINGVDGKVQLVEGGKAEPVAGTRDWGSDLAALHSGCGAGVQIVVSGSGEAVRDSLRAFELPALEAVPVSAPLAMDGTVTALLSAPDGKSVLAVVERAGAPGRGDEFEVDRVTANCS